MAEVRKVVVEVLNGKGGGGGSPAEDKNLNEKISKASKNSASDVINTDKLKQAARGVLEQVSSLAEGFADYELNRYFSLSEDYLGENTYNQIKGYYGAVKNVTSGLKSGAMEGFMVGGPIGAVFGAVVGGTMSAANLAVQHRQKMASFYKQLNETNIQTAFSASRMNLVDGGQNTSN